MIGRSKEPVTRLETDIYGSGPPVVLIHGQPGSAADWARVVPLLQDDHTVVVPDRPGYGRTAGRATGFAGNAAVLASTLDRLGCTPAVLVGHSWGGGVALATVINHPQTANGLVLAASVRPGEPLSWVDRMLASPGIGDALAAITIGSTGLVLRNAKVRELVERRFDGQAREVVRALEGVAGAKTRAPVWRSFVEEQRRLFDELGDLAPLLNSVAVPTAVISGGSDRIVPSAVGARLASAIPGAVHRVVAGAHHLLPLDHPHEIDSAIRETEARVP